MVKKSRTEENLSEADLRRYKAPAPEKGGREPSSYRRSREMRRAERRERAYYRERQRELKHGVKEELKRGIDFSQVITAGGTGAIEVEKEAQKVTEGVQWHTDKGGPHGGKGFAPGGGDEGEGVGREPGQEGAADGAGTEEGGKGRRITLKGTMPANIVEAAEKSEAVLKRLQSDLRQLDKAIGDEELEELEEGDDDDEGEEDEDDDDGEPAEEAEA